MTFSFINRAAANSSRQTVFTADELRQGTDEWHKFRAEGIGASEAAAVLGMNPFQSAIDLWRVKTGASQPRLANAAMQRGICLEQEARKAFADQTGIISAPFCLIHPEHEWMRASLDGLGDDQSVVELKCPGLRTHLTAAHGRIPSYYYPQLQHQLVVANALFGIRRAHYVSYFPVEELDQSREDVESLVHHTIELDEEFAGEMLKTESEFWQSVTTRRMPKTDADKRLVEVRVDGEWQQAAERFRRLQIQKERAEMQLAEAREELLALVDETNDVTFGGGVRVQRLARAGAVQYERIPELDGVNLDLYRKPATAYSRVIVEKKAL